MTGTGDLDSRVRDLMRTNPDALNQYHGWMHGFHGFPYEGCGMTDLGPHEGPAFESGLGKGRSDKERRVAGPDSTE
jgi:hypothetical protein